MFSKKKKPRFEVIEGPECFAVKDHKDNTFFMFMNNQNMENIWVKNWHTHFLKCWTPDQVAASFLAYKFNASEG